MTGVTAMKDHARSTGNGRRESYKHRPIPTNDEHHDRAGRIGSCRDPSFDPVGAFCEKNGRGTGEHRERRFCVRGERRYLIENGAIGEPVRGATLIGNGPQVLMSIDRVGSDLGYSIGTCGKDGQGSPVSDAQPTLRIPEIVVGGEVA